MSDEFGIIIQPGEIPKNIDEKSLIMLEKLIEENLVKHYGEGIWNTLESLRLVEEARLKIRTAQELFKKQGEALAKTK